MILSPVILVLSFIFIIYGTYLGGYIIVLLNGDNEIIRDRIFSFNSTFIVSQSFTKGLTLLIITFYFLSIFLVAFMRTVMMDPGFFTSPIDFEKNIIEKASQIDPNDAEALLVKNRTFHFLTNFSKLSEIGPLNDRDEAKYRNDLENNLSNILERRRVVNAVERDSAITNYSDINKSDRIIIL